MSVIKKLCILFLFFSVSSAFAVPSRLIDGVEISKDKNKEVMDIKFTVPLNYTGHFPRTKGKTLVLNVRAFISESKLVLTSSNGEKSKIPANKSKLVNYLRVESLDNNTGKLALQFNKPVVFSVRQMDKKTIQITLTRDTKQATKTTRKRNASTKKTTASVPFKSFKSAGNKSKKTKIVYVLNLESYKKSKKPRNIPNLDIFDEYKLFRTRVKTRSKVVTRLRLGFFKNKSTANRVKRQLKTYYPNVWLDVIQKNEGSLSKKYFAAVKLKAKKKPRKTKVAKTKPIPVKSSDLNKILLLMEKGDLAFIEKRYRNAISFYTKVYNIASGEQKQLALERIGVTRERNGQKAHAKAEYEKYLKLYTEGEGYERVKQQLEAMLTATVEPKKALVSSKKTSKDDSEPWEFFSNLSQAYRYQQSKNETDNSSTTSETDNSISTYFSTSGTKRSKDFDMKVQFDGDQRYDMSVDNDRSDFGVSSLYFDYISNTGYGSIRLGRQSQTSGGVLGRFDGVWYGYPYSNDISLNFVTGLPVESGDGIKTNTHQFMYGASAEFLRIYKNIDISTFIIEQTVDGISDRRAVGGEIRSISDNSSMFTYIDYDISYNLLNRIQYVANWIFKDNKSINVVADYSLTPLITTTNALQGQGEAYIEELLQRLNESQVRQLAEERTAEFTSVTVSGNMDLSQKYSLSADISLSELAATPASNIGNVTIDKTDASGLEMFLSVQFIGSNLFSTRDTNIIALRYSDTQNSSTTTIDGRSQFNLDPKWRARPRARFEIQSRSSGSDVMRFDPSVRFDYRYNRDLEFDFEVGFEFSQTSDSVNGDSSDTDIFFGVEYIYSF